MILVYKLHRISLPEIEAYLPHTYRLVSLKLFSPIFSDIISVDIAILMDKL